jgi:hypothetical protein
MSETQAPQTQKIPLPNVPVEAVEGFAKVWKTPGGLTLMLDPSTKQFALDFARVTLRSFIIANIKAAEAAAAKAAAQAPAPKSSLIITDL